MEERTVRYGQNHYLRLPLSETESELYEIRMISANAPKGLLRLRLTRDGTDTFADYSVTDLVSLKESEEDEDLQQYLYSIVFSLERLADTLDQYLLPEEKVTLSPERIFLRKELGQTFFCFYPGETGTVSENLTEMMEFFLKRLRPSEEKEILLLYGLYRKAREPNVTLRSLAEYYRAQEKKEEEVRELLTEIDRGTDEEMLPEQEEKTSPGPAETGMRDEADDDYLYREFGIERPRKETSFEVWQKSRAGQGTRANPEPEEEEIPFPDDAFEEPKADLKTRVGSFLKRHSLEVGVGAVVLIGTVVILAV